MILSLDNEIEPYQPFGRSIINLIPNPGKTVSKKPNINNDETILPNNSFNNDFITAELDLTRDLFRSINEAQSFDKAKSVLDDFWKLRKTPKGEEELYVRGNSVICSHKPTKNQKTSFLDKSFTFNERIIDTVWCDFIIKDNTSALVKAFANEYKIDCKRSENLRYYTKIIKTICILDRYSIHIVSEHGDYYRKLLPFRVSRMMATNHGLMFERVEMEDKTSHYPTIFLLSNPLNDLNQVILVGGKSTIGYLNNLNLVNIIQEKNLVIFYCSKTKTHCIFYLRSVTQCDLHFYHTRINETISENRNSDHNLSFNNFLSTPVANEHAKKQKFSGLTSSISRNANSNLMSMIQQGSSNRNSSPLTSITNANLNSPLNSRHSLSNEVVLKSVRSQSVSNLISSRMDSPVSPSLNRLQFSNAAKLNDIDFETPTHIDGRDSLSINFNKIAFRTSSFKTPNSSLHSPTPTSLIKPFDAFSLNHSETNVDFALEFIWSEAQSTASQSTCDNIGSKAFISSDFLGQSYLCLVAKNAGGLSSNGNSYLKLIRFDQATGSQQETDSTKPKRAQYIFYESKVINVKDAEPLASLNMIIVLDENNTLILYTGVYKVAIVHLTPEASVFKQTALGKNSMCLTPGISGKPGAKTCTFSPNLSAEFLAWSPGISQIRDGKIHHASSPIGNSSQPMDARVSSGDFSFSIQQYPSFGEIVKLRDSIDNRVTIQTENSDLYRLSFPLMTSTFLVDKCIAGLQQTLPKEVILNFLSAWYTSRNSTNKEEKIPEIVRFKLCLFSSVGFDQESIKKYYAFKNQIVMAQTDCSKTNRDNSTDQNESFKKIKIDDEQDQGCNEDFYKLLSDNNMKLNSGKGNLERCFLKSEHSSCMAFLYPYVPHVLYSMHLIYEDLKLIQMNWPQCKAIVDVLYMLATNLQLSHYTDHYYRDFWPICSEISNDVSESFLANQKAIIYPPYFTFKPFSAYKVLFSLLQGNPSTNNDDLFPYIGFDGNDEIISIVTPNIFNLILLYANLNPKEFIHPQLILQNVGHKSGSNTLPFVNVEKFQQIASLYANIGQDVAQNEVRDHREKIIFLISALGLNQQYIQQLPFGLALPLWEIIFHFRMNPKNDWCSSIYSLIDRQDLLSLESQSKFLKRFSRFTKDNENVNNFAEELEYLDSQVLRLLFPNDQRLHEAYRLLISNKPVIINIKQEHRMADSEFVEEQEKHLLALSFRTMALPLGRGMVTLRSYSPIVVERFPIPPLILQGKIPPRHIIYLSHIDVPPNMNIWPLFHNGVSAGLRISSSPNRMVDSSWILFNKPPNCSTADEHYQHAGFLLALGLNGLLDNLSIMDLHDYLSKGNDLTKVAILLGLAASRRGTMDSTAFVLLGIHLEGLLPSTSTELDVSPIVRVAAVLGTGLLFQGTGHRYISEVMLNEIGRPPGPEMDHYIDRESYALSAGLAFGLVTLGRGNELMNMMTSDGISIPDQLNHYMLGVHKKMSTLQKEKTKTPSYHIREGDRINADVTSPGATLALGMMFFNTGNKAIVQWLNVPDTQNLLEMVRPDFLLLRVLAKNLILWSDIKPTSQWIESYIPSIIYNHAFQRNNVVEKPLDHELMFSDDIDYETMTQSYCNIIAGACFALALKYAGSANDEAFEVVYKYTYKLVILIQKGNTSQIEQAGKSTIESCVNILIVSCAIIMAGTGNVEIMRICRFLRSRVNQTHVLYGSFMAIHMALGLLFLGGCKMTLNSSPESVAALICAFFPKYPMHANDNRYHLQAFRHLYVLASETRLLVPSCIDTGLAQYANIRYTFKDRSLNSVERIAPCLLPELNLLESVELIDNNYWQISFQSDANFFKLRNCLKLNGKLYIKKKIKCLSYNKDYIYNSSEANNFKNPFKFSATNKMNRKSFTLFDFTNEVVLKTFAEVFNNSHCVDHELSLKNKICSILYDCAEDETLDLFVPLIKLISSCSAIISKQNIGVHNREAIRENRSQDSLFRYLLIWQIRLASHYLNDLKMEMPSKYRMIETIRFQLENYLKNSVDRAKLCRYLEKDILINECDERVIDTIVYYDFPFEKFSIVKGTKLLSLLKSLRSYSSNCVRSAFFLAEILNSPT